MVDQVLLIRKFDSIREHLRRIEDWGDVSLDRFRNEIVVQDVCLFRLEKAAQDCIDISLHVVSDQAWGTPDSYAKAFEVLAARQVIDTPMLEFMQSFVGFRNVLVHQYGVLSIETAYRFYAERSKIEDFCEAVRRKFKLK